MRRMAKMIASKMCDMIRSWIILILFAMIVNNRTRIFSFSIEISSSEKNYIKKFLISAEIKKVQIVPMEFELNDRGRNHSPKLLNLSEWDHHSNASPTLAFESSPMIRLVMLASIIDDNQLELENFSFEQFSMPNDFDPNRFESKPPTLSSTKRVTSKSKAIKPKTVEANLSTNSIDTLEQRSSVHKFPKQCTTIIVALACIGLFLFSILSLSLIIMKKRQQSNHSFLEEQRQEQQNKHQKCQDKQQSCESLNSIRSIGNGKEDDNQFDDHINRFNEGDEVEDDEFDDSDGDDKAIGIDDGHLVAIEILKNFDDNRSNENKSIK
ncbi:hypothetical protein NH340_JMT00717 [Sarcoptes scabiei]|nr:hypothetical protein NH340_JMT00717 [Sarcoptes scabiei]